MAVSMQRNGASVSLHARRVQAADRGAVPPLHNALARTIEAQIVPRLVVRRLPPAMAAAGHEADAEHAAPSTDAINLATLAIGPHEHAVRHQVQNLAGQRTMEAVCLELLAPAARYLGELWTEDLCSFTDVTIGLLRLQDALHGVTADLGLGGAEGFRRHRIVLAAAPGDQHTFGLSMVSSFFQKAGWGVTTLHDSTLPDLAALLRREWIGVLGFSVGSEARLERLAAVMPRLRDQSRNAGLSIMVGGPIFVAFPHLAAQIGADATASDGMQATWVAENLLAEGATYG